MSTDDPRRATSAGIEPNCVILDEARLFEQRRLAPAKLELARERALPAVPPWVTDVRKWQSLSRAERRALERHHRKQTKR